MKKRLIMLVSIMTLLTVPAFAFDGQMRAPVHSCGGTMHDYVETAGSWTERVTCEHKLFGHDTVTYTQYITYRVCNNCGYKMQLSSETKVTNVECHGYY